MTFIDNIQGSLGNDINIEKILRSALTISIPYPSETSVYLSVIILMDAKSEEFYDFYQKIGKPRMIIRTVCQLLELILSIYTAVLNVLSTSNSSYTPKLANQQVYKMSQNFCNTVILHLHSMVHSALLYFFLRNYNAFLMR